MRMAISGLWDVLTTSSTFPATEWVPQKSKQPSTHSIQQLRNQPLSASRTKSRAKTFTHTSFLKQASRASDALKKELVAHVRKEIGPIASPGKIQFVPGLPKTRSGKIMRRILRKVASGELDQLGDTTTLADPSVVDDIVKGRQ